MKIHYHTILEKDPNPENVHLNEVGKKITIEYDNLDQFAPHVENLIDAFKKLAAVPAYKMEISETASEPVQQSMIPIQTLEMLVKEINA